MRKITYLMLVLFCTMLGVPQSAGAQAVFTKTLYSQDHEAENLVASSVWKWTSAGNGSYAIVDTESGYGKAFRLTAHSSDNAKAGGAYINFQDAAPNFTDVVRYTIEFDANVTSNWAGSNSTNGNFGAQLVLMNEATTMSKSGNTTRIDYGVADMQQSLFAMNQGVVQGDAKYTVRNEAAAEKQTISLTSGAWYHYQFVVDASGATKTITYTITDSEGNAVENANGESFALAGDSYICKGIYFRTGRKAADATLVDNVKLTTEVSIANATVPTVTLTGVDGVSRIYTATCEEYETLHYQIGTGEEQTAETNRAEIRVEESATLYVWTTVGESASAKVEENVVCEAVALAAPSIVFKSVEKTGRYLSNVIFTVTAPDNSDILLAPATEKMEYTFTPEDGTESERTEIADVAAFEYTPTAKGVLRVYASTPGYTESSYEMPMSNYYVKDYRSADYSKATAEQINGWGFTTNAGEKLGSTAYNHSSWAATFEHFRNYPAYFVQNLGLYRSATQTTALQLRYFKKGNIEQFKYNTSVATGGEENVKDANVETDHISYAHFFAFSGNGAATDYSPQNGRTGCYYMPAGNILMQHLTFRPGTESETVFTPEVPAITLKAVEGANRIYTISNPNTEDDGRLYYVVSTAEEAPVVGDAAYTMTAEASVELTVTENSTIYAYCTDEQGQKATDIVAQPVEVGEMTLADPTLAIQQFAQDETDAAKLHAVVSVTSDNSALPVAPTVVYTASFTPKNGTAAEATLAADGTYTFTEAGTLTVTATATGYTSSQPVSITLDGSYAVARSIDFTALTKDNLTEAEQANPISDWKSGNVIYNGWQLSNPNSTLVEGLTFNGDLWQLIYIKGDAEQKTVGVGNRQNRSKSIDHKLRNGQIAEFSRGSSSIYQQYTTGTEKTTIPEWSILKGYTVYSSNDVEAQAEVPTIAMTRVDGKNREYTITFDATAGEVLHYTMPGELEELTATESPKVITVTRDGTITAWTTLGETTSEQVSEEVVTGDVTLAEARITMKTIATVTEKYAANPTFLINKPNNENVTLKPATEVLEYTFTPAGGTESERTAVTEENFEFTPTTNGVLKVYASTAGYTTSVNAFPVSNYYAVSYESRDFSTITAEELSELSGTYTKNENGTWFADSYRLSFSGNNLTFDRLYIGNSNTVDLVMGWGYGRTGNSYGFRARYATKGNLFTLFYHTDTTGADPTAVENRTELETSGTGTAGNFTPYIYVPKQNTLFQLKDYAPANAPVAQQPVVAMTKVVGADREYTITFQEEETLHYILPGAEEEQTATKSPVVVTVTESGELKAWTTLCISKSDVVTVSVVTGELQLNAPKCELVEIGYGFMKRYSVTADNSDIAAVAPEVTVSYVFTPANGETEEAVTIAEDDDITLIKKGSMVITVEAEGFTSNSVTVTNSQAYQLRTTAADFAAMTAADFDSRWTEGKQSDGNWKFMQVTKYTLNDVADAATVFDGVTLFSNKKPTVYLGYGLMAPHLDVDGMTASEYGDISIKQPVEGEMAVYTYLHSKDKDNAQTAVQPVADVYHLVNYSDILQRIDIYKPIADEDVIDGISTVSRDTDGNDRWYNLAGQSVAQPAKKGLYIVNGRTVVVK